MKMFVFCLTVAVLTWSPVGAYAHCPEISDEAMCRLERASEAFSRITGGVVSTTPHCDALAVS